MTIAFMPSYLSPKACHAAKRPRFSATPPGPSRIGSGGSKSVGFSGSWTKNAPVVHPGCRKSIWKSLGKPYAKRPKNMVYPVYGMAKRSPCLSDSGVGLPLASGNVSDCFQALGFGFANRVRRWLMQTRKSRRHIKKLHDLAQDARFDLWALDEVRFEQHGSACRMGVPPEVTDPVLPHHPTRKGIGYLGAVRIRDGKFIDHREEDRFNGETFFSFLKQIRRASCHSGRHVVLILDDVRYHHAKLHLVWREKHRDSMTLTFMPPYSPELNPIERVWKLTRRMANHNRYFQTLNAVISSVENVFDKWHYGSHVLKQLCVI